MVKIKETSYFLPDGSIKIETWLDEVAKKRHSHNVQLIEQACNLAQFGGGNTATFTGQSCLQLGIKMAEILLDLKADQTTIAAAILYHCVTHTELEKQDISEQINENVTKLIEGAQKMDSIRSLFSHSQSTTQQAQTNVDNLRKMLLAMVSDVRVVLLKLAEITTLAHAATKLDEDYQCKIAHEVSSIYAPLANRLGIGQIKWELEDLTLRFLQPQIYKKIAKSIDQKRIEREKYINLVINVLQEKIADANIKNFEVTGRAKNINSIYRKMERKDVDYSQIYDISAVRILVQKVEDCYSVLGCVHGLWKHIPEEFDDYITKPKPNGYRSLHTAVVGPNDRNVEVQIRTYDMHKESELGFAAHWKYKEGAQKASDYENKIAWLRQVLSWQQELSDEQTKTDQQSHQDIFEDRIYVFTPAGQIMDLPQYGTPLDFAYSIHTEIGHRCKGAKVDGKIAPLTYQLKTGERVEILTGRNANPSRDWLIPSAGYLKSSRARAKIHHWFKKQDYDKNVLLGHDHLDHELSRLHIKNTTNRNQLLEIAKKYNFQTSNDLYAAIGAGDIGLNQVVNALQQNTKKIEAKPSIPKSQVKWKAATTGKRDIIIHGIDDLLSFNAKCCKPVPGDPITGFITKGRGISIHRSNCPNIINNPHKTRLIKTQWRAETHENYPVDIALIANERQGLIKDILAILSNEKIPLQGLTTKTKEMYTTIHFSIIIPEKDYLDRLLQRLSQVPDVNSISRHVVESKEKKSSDE